MNLTENRNEGVVMSNKTHIYDWLDKNLPSLDSVPDKDFVYAVRWLDEFTKPAHLKDNAFLDKNPLYVSYRDGLYRCMGASRLGDVWLSEDLTGHSGYSKRVNVDDLYFWQSLPHTGLRTKEIFFSDNGEASIEVCNNNTIHVFCAQAHRRKGLAGKVMRDVTKWADANKICLRLCVVRHDRESTETQPSSDDLVKFYTKHGFVVVNESMPNRVFMQRNYASTTIS